MSNINATDINIYYPIAGQDNDTQGFRDNFSIIQQNFNIASTEITQLQGNAASYPVLTTVPITSSAPGVPGQIAYSTSGPYYLYVCIANNTWLRGNLSTF